MRRSKLFAVQKGNAGTMRFRHSERDYTPIFLYGFFALVCVGFIILALRLFQLTIVKGSYYHNLAEGNRVREITIEARRGSVRDRNGTVLAQSTDADPQEDEKRILSTRSYTSPEPYAHVVGYRQLADENDIQDDVCIHKLELGDKTGKKGVERAYDCLLRGKNGKKLLELDARGEVMKTLSVQDPEPGQDITLALDYGLQKKAYEAIEGQRAVVVAMDPRNGEVLALASWPSFDPQAFEDDDRKIISDYLTDEIKPLFNRATEGTYPPGSVYKMTVASAALEEDVVDPQTTILDTGVLEVGPARYHNWYYLEFGGTDGEVDVKKALQRSNDIYFYKIGDMLGPERIKSWSHAFGFERLTGIGISETAGTIPSPFWKEDTLGEEWFTGDTYNLSIGQGYALVTPLQVNVATAVFANNGKLCKPQLLKLDGSNASAELPSLEPDCRDVPVSQETIDVIKEGMVQACEPGGTGVPFFNFRVLDRAGLKEANITVPEKLDKEDEENESSLAALLTPEKIGTQSAFFQYVKPVSVACKTGTAESFGEGFDPHAWFTVYAPVEDPEIVLTVLVEEGGEGSKVAAPIAKEVLRWWVEDDK